MTRCEMSVFSKSEPGHFGILGKWASYCLPPQLSEIISPTHPPPSGGYSSSGKLVRIRV